jgi:hypothetical protein
MDVSQDDGTDVLEVGAAKRGTWRTVVSRRASRIMLTIKYDALHLVCEFFQISFAS